MSAFARIAILTDITPYTTYSLNAELDPPGLGQGVFAPAKNQGPNPLRYRLARGVYVEDLDYGDLTTGTLSPPYPDINPLTPLPITIAAPFN